MFKPAMIIQSHLSDITEMTNGRISLSLHEIKELNTRARMVKVLMAYKKNNKGATLEQSQLDMVWESLYNGQGEVVTLRALEAGVFKMAIGTSVKS